MAKNRENSGAEANGEAQGFRIRTPARFFRGERAGVRFVDGVGVTSDPEKAADCARFGYEVTNLDTEDVVNPLDKPAKEARAK